MAAEHRDRFDEIASDLPMMIKARVRHSSIDIPSGHRFWPRPCDAEMQHRSELILALLRVGLKITHKTHSGGIVADSWMGRSY